MKIIRDSGTNPLSLQTSKACPRITVDERILMKIKRLSRLLLELALAAIFLYSGLQKHLHPDEFVEAVLAYKILPLGLAGMTAAILPPVECAAGLLLAIGYKKRSSLLLLALLVCLFLAAIVITMMRGLNIDCGCGLFLSRQVGWVALLEDSLLLVLACGLYCWEVLSATAKGPGLPHANL